MTLRITESELARDVRAVLAKIEQGSEVIIESEDHSPVAVMRKAQSVGRTISDCITRAQAAEAKLGHAPAPDPDFGRDVQAGIDARREPILNLWDD